MSKASRLVVAVTAGFVAGLLLAPKSGKETRDMLKDKAVDSKRYADKTLDRIKNISVEVNEIGEEVKAQAGRLAEETRHTVDRIQRNEKVMKK